MTLSFDDAIKVVYTSDGSIAAIYELENGQWELEDFDDEKVASAEGQSIIIKEYDDGQLEEVEIYSPTSLDFTDPDPTPAGTVLFRSSRVEIEGDDDDDDLEGSEYDDDIFCGDGNDKAYGGSGNDNMIGGNGNDRLDGGSDNDSLQGGNSDDILIGGTGKDIMRGNAGRDHFIFTRTSDSSATARRDIIVDFLSRTDKVVLTQIDANSKTTANDSFSYINGMAFSGKAGELRYSGGIISGDVNGDKKADFQIALQGAPRLSATDFAL